MGDELRPRRGQGPGRRSITVLLALLTAVCGACTATSARTAASGQLYVAPTGSDARDCSASAPCATFAAAYRKARPGDTVVVAGGRYGTQTIPYDATKSGAGVVTFRPAAGATADLSWDPATQTGELLVSADDVVLAGTETAAEIARGARVGFDVGSLQIDPEAGGGPPHAPFGDTVSNANMNQLLVSGAHDVTISGGQIGPFKSCLYPDGSNAPDACQNAGSFMAEDGADFDADVVGGTTYDLTHLRLQGIFTHDVTKPAPGTSDCTANPASCIAHTDCWQFGSGQDITVSGNTFENCADSDIFTGYQEGSGFSNWLIEDNVFGLITPPGAPAYYDVQISSSGANGRTCPGIVLRSNVVVGADYTLSCSPTDAADRARFVANVVPSTDAYGCQATQWSRTLNLYYDPTSARCNVSETVLGRRTLTALTPARLRSGLARVGFTCGAASTGTPSFFLCRATVKGQAYSLIAVAAQSSIAALELVAAGTSAPTILPRVLEGVAGLAYAPAAVPTKTGWAGILRALRSKGRSSSRGVTIRTAHDQDTTVVDISAP